MSAGLGLNHLARNSMYNFTRQLWAIVLGMAISILLARGLGAADRGIYAIALLLPTLLVTLFNLGVGPATIYHVGRDPRTFEAAVRGNIALAFWISILALSVGLLLSLFGGQTLFPGVPLDLLLLALVSVPIAVHSSYLAAVLQGLEDFRTYNLIIMIPQMVNLVLILLLVWWLPGGVYGAMAAYLAGNLAALLLLIGVFWRRMPTRRVFALWIDWPYTREVMHYGLRAHISNIIAFLNYRADMFLLNLLMGASSVGLYTVAVTLGERLWIATNSVSAVMLPRVAAMDDRETERRQLTPLIARHIFWLSLLIAVAAALLAQWVIVLLYSAEFQEAATALRVLLPGITLLSVSKILANDIAGRGRPELNSQQSIVAFGLNLAANLILIPRMGINGSALATTISYSFLTLIKTISYCRMTTVSWQSIYLPQPGDRERLQQGARLALKRLRPA